MKHSSATSVNKRRTSEDESPISTKRQEERPKSKKELRKERKAALKAPAKSDAVDNKRKRADVKDSQDRKRQRREEKRLERKVRKQEKEAALEARFREQDELRKGKLADNKEPETTKQPQSAGDKKKVSKKNDKESSTKKQKRDQTEGESSGDLAVFKSVYNKKSIDPSTGATTCRLGVQYIDKKVGSGPPVKKKSLVTVKYQLRGGSPSGVLLDSSKNFKFRVGKGEVIQGWEIGLEGMQQGGVRHLIVPPKAGYGSKDIGAGSGAMLYFDITLLEIRSHIVHLGR
ncbi:FK506-binding protein 4 [Seminavis robusta]|uniref:peptidylprolyl isomerase n=1 Tax=Seminavis robusta TaxID=568900 RepID=A0A9N8E0G8_9STRA|nr:FK506-binding protein 4 [Seminavis robusta]|eukprot:Sro526_g160380.1 FK506-binding protein 4 (287) ;mRNA; r:27801-28661